MGNAYRPWADPEKPVCGCKAPAEVQQVSPGLKDPPPTHLRTPTLLAHRRHASTLRRTRLRAPSATQPLNLPLATRTDGDAVNEGPEAREGNGAFAFVLPQSARRENTD